MRANEFLTEAIIDVTRDVDAIYDGYFAQTVAEIANGTWDGKVVKDTIYTSDLVSPLCIKADQVNPCEININKSNSGGNWYRPGDQLINITFNQQVLGLIRQAGSMKDAMAYVGEKANQFRTEISPAIVKGSIHHELAHWVQDSLNNRHIGKLVDKAMQSGARGLVPDGQDVNAHHMERDSQVHNVLQLKREYEQAWDHMTFIQMIQLSPAMNATYSMMPPDQRVVWLKKLKTRLAREGLLGQNMR